MSRRVGFPGYPRYKESGVEWLGNIPAHWHVQRLKRGASVFPSNVDKKTYDDGLPVRLCNYTDVYYNERITDELDFMTATASAEQVIKFTLRAGDTLITKDSETADDIAVAAYVPADLPGVVCGYHLSVVRPTHDVDGAFVKRLFDSVYVKSSVEVRANGLTRVGLGQYALDNLELPFPPLREQRLISAFLDRETAKIDALVAEQRRLMEVLKEKRQAVISHAVTKGLNPDAPMKPSGIEWLGDVPKHWHSAPLKHLCSLIKDGTHLPPERVDHGVPLLSVRNIISGHFSRREDDSMISEKSYLDLCRSFVPLEGDVLLAIVGATLGKTAVVQGEMEQFHIQRSLAVFRSRADRLKLKFLHMIFQSKPFQSMLWQLVGYSAQPGIYLGTLENVRVAVPPLAEQERAIASVTRDTSELNTLETEAVRAIELLQERRTALISAVVTGQIDVRGLVELVAA